MTERYQNLDVRQLYLNGLDYVYSRGVDENAWLPDHAGIASKLALEAGLPRLSGDLFSQGLFLGGFIQSVFLMREQIAPRVISTSTGVYCAT